MKGTEKRGKMWKRENDSVVGGIGGGNDALNRRKEACHCKNVTYGMIEDAIRNGADTVEQVMEATGAGKGCGKCRDFLAYLIRDILEEQKP